MKKYKEEVKKELLKCNNFNYCIEYGCLKLKIKTTKINHLLINQSYSFEGRIDSNWLFIYESKYNQVYLSCTYFWSKFESNNFSHNEIIRIMNILLEKNTQKEVCNIFLDN